ncbi:MAG: cytochrome oxidase biogenesis protein Surf1,facilitates heme A insertion [Gammaproteobacteria bacterium HGW-Gammaproteobacteria-11]|nr:MAG: cytochrome oxidase biogenesis protein Surf1,facilitates heme A insertion [Gammaproteobacteria bacterium HGW-Gammaproteobacteria-11]
MSESRNSLRFAPGWPLWLFLLAFIPLLISLGFWQLDRAEEKRQMQAQMDQNRGNLSLPLSDLLKDSDPAWRPVYLQGEFDQQAIWLLDNRTRNGRAGVEVLQAFNDVSGQRVLVNRGWLPWPDRQQLPALPPAAGTLALDAELLPEAGEAFTLGDDSPDDGWPRLISHIDMQQLELDSGQALLPWIARLRIGSPAALTLDWPPLPMTSSKHTGYAVQWFALATALLALFIWAGFRPEPRGE